MCDGIISNHGTDEARTLWCDWMRCDAKREGCQTHLLHYTSFALGKGYVSPRFILDELDLNLASLASRFVVIIVVVVGRAGSLSLDAAILPGLDPIAVANGIVVAGRGVLVVFGKF